MPFLHLFVGSYFFGLQQEPPLPDPHVPVSFIIKSLTFLLFLTLSLIALAKAKKRRNEDQKAADENARKLEEALLGNDRRPFALYLRPFLIDKKVRVWEHRLSRIPRLRMMQWLLRDKVNYDYRLRREFETWLRTSLLSFDAGDKPGASHLRATDSNWEEKFQLLAPSAQTIVVVPGISDGIIKEMRWLMMAGLVDITVFLKPKGYPKKKWTEARLSFEKGGVRLPPYYSKELSFRIDSSGRCYQEHKWRPKFRYSKEDLDMVMRRRLLANRPLDGSNDAGLALLPRQVFAPWPVTFWLIQCCLLFLAIFYLAEFSIEGVPALGSLITDPLQPIEIMKVAILSFMIEVGVVSLLAIWGLLIGRRYGKWLGIISLFVGWIFINGAEAEHQINTCQLCYEFTSSPVSAVLWILFLQVPLIFMLRLTFSKYLNDFFS